MPFPQGDSLYGQFPDPADEDFGVHFGTIAPKGERGVLAVSLDALIRMSSNPFFDEMLPNGGAETWREEVFLASEGLKPFNLQAFREGHLTPLYGARHCAISACAT